MRSSARAPTATRLGGSGVLRRAGAADDTGEMVGGPPTGALTRGSRRYAPPVAEFLSEAWIVALDRAARAAPDLASVAPDAPLVIEQRVRRDGDEVVYALCFDATGARVVPGPASSPDAVLVTDAPTAWALALGTISAQQAAVTGHLKLRGDVERLRAAGEALRAVADVFSEVRSDTTYVDEGDPGPSARR